MQKIAIVTGASRGFGRGIAAVLSMQGEYKVFVTARNKVALESLKREVDQFDGAGEIIPYVLDQNNDKEVEKFDLVPIETVMETIKNCPHAFKYNCNLVIIDFLIREGLISEDHENFKKLVEGLRYPII